MNKDSMFFLKIEKIKKIFFEHKRAFREPRIYPQRDWMVLVVFVFSLAIAINGIVFYEMNRGVVDTLSPVTVSVDDINVQQITETAIMYRAKEERFRAIIGTSGEDHEDQVKREGVSSLHTSMDEGVTSEPESSY